LKELFIRQIEDMIISGSLEIGTQLPSERELAQKMGISRTIVNAGIAEMAGKGFLEIRPRVGIFVNDFRRFGKIGAILSIMTYNGGALRQEEIRSILEIRLALDRLSIENIIGNSSDHEIANLEPLVQAIGQTGNSSDCAKALFDYHHAFSVATGNSLIPLIYSSFSIPITALWERYGRLYGTDTLYKSTRTLYNLVKSRQRCEALTWVEKYLRETIKGPREIYGN